MDDGYCVLQWAHQNGHTVTSISKKVGYSRSMLSQSLNHNQISARLAEELYRHYRLRVVPTISSPWQSERDPRDKTDRQRGRRSRRKTGETSSKLDKHADEISQLLAQGVSQKDIASRYDTAPSTLNAWLARHGLRLPRSHT